MVLVYNGPLLKEKKLEELINVLITDLELLIVICIIVMVFVLIVNIIKIPKKILYIMKVVVIKVMN